MVTKRVIFVQLVQRYVYFSKNGYMYYVKLKILSSLKEKLLQVKLMVIPMSMIKSESQFPSKVRSYPHNLSTHWLFLEKWKKKSWILVTGFFQIFLLTCTFLPFHNACFCNIPNTFSKLHSNEDLNHNQNIFDIFHLFQHLELVLEQQEWQAREVRISCRRPCWWQWNRSVLFKGLGLNG